MEDWYNEDALGRTCFNGIWIFIETKTQHKHLIHYSNLQQKGWRQSMIASIWLILLFYCRFVMRQELIHPPTEFLREVGAGGWKDKRIGQSTSLENHVWLWNRQGHSNKNKHINNSKDRQNRINLLSVWTNVTWERKKWSSLYWWTWGNYSVEGFRDRPFWIGLWRSMNFDRKRLSK